MIITEIKNLNVRNASFPFLKTILSKKCQKFCTGIILIQKKVLKQPKFIIILSETGNKRVTEIALKYYRFSADRRRL